MNQERHESLLNAIYDRFLAKHDLEPASADEILYERITERTLEEILEDEICLWLDRFIHIWERCGLGGSMVRLPA